MDLEIYQRCRGIVYELWDQTVLGWTLCEGASVWTWKFGKSVQVADIWEDQGTLTTSELIDASLDWHHPSQDFHILSCLSICENIVLPTRPSHKSLPYISS